MRRKGYVLCFALALIFLVSSILALSVMRLTYFSDIASAYLTRNRVRNELISLTNFSLKWLAAKLETGDRPAADGAVSFRVFVWPAGRNVSPERGSVEIFDMSCAIDAAYPSDDELPFFPPHFPDGYLIRAAGAGKGQATLIMESVYLMTSGDAPLGGRFYKLEKTPVYSREIFR
jgi:hypothetical protein